MTRTDGPAAPGLHLRRGEPDPRSVEGEDAMDGHRVRGAAPAGAPRHRAAAHGGVRRDLRARAGGRLHRLHARPSAASPRWARSARCSPALMEGQVANATTASRSRTSRRWPRASCAPSASARGVCGAAGTLAPRWRTTDSNRTRYDPAEVEERVFASLGGGRGLPRRARRRAGGQLLDRRPAAERHRLAAHGARAQRHDPGRVHPGRADARPARQVDLRHRPRGHRHAARGGARAGRGRGRPRRSSAGSASPSASGSGASSTAPRSPSSSSASAPRSTTRTSASRWTPTTCAR